MKAIVLAAGLGKRLNSEKSNQPKCLREAAGKPLLSHVLSSLDFIPKGDIIIVVGYKRELIINRFPEYTFAVQEKQLGTGDAIRSAMPLLEEYDGQILAAYGDMPLVKKETYLELLGVHEYDGNDCTVMSDLYEGSDIPAFGRIIKENGRFSRIIEARDCTDSELLIRELNTGIYVFNSEPLISALKLLTNNNSQNEFYLTDVPGIIASRGGKVGVLSKPLGAEAIGVNTPEELAAAETFLIVQPKQTK